MQAQTSPGVLRSTLNRIAYHLKTLRSLSRPLGWRGALAYVFQDLRLRRFGNTRPYRLWSKMAAHPVWCRPNTSDLEVFRQVFVFQDYEPLRHLSRVDTVIDCGSNVGYAASYLLSSHPNCRLIAVEPDPLNFAALKENLKPFGGRAMALQAGVWSHPCNLRIEDEPYRDGLEWSKQVRPVDSSSPATMEGVDVPTLMSRADFSRVSILKVDIEGAEVVVFGETAGAWLSKIDNIAVELHDDSHFGSGSEAFHKAIAGENFLLSTSGELTLAGRPS